MYNIESVTCKFKSHNMLLVIVKSNNGMLYYLSVMLRVTNSPMILVSSEDLMAHM